MSRTGGRRAWSGLAVAGSIGLASLFLLLPGIDLWFSRLFYDVGVGFHLRDAVWVRLLYDLVPILTIGLIFGLLILLAVDLARRRTPGPFDRRAIVYLLAVLAVGPGLTVNVVFKDHWGRARPRDITDFGGSRMFSPAFVISDQCERNCSFVSGHAAVPFALVALAFVLRRRRKFVLAASVGFGGLVGMARIVAGAHFLSDVIFSGVFVALVAYMLAHAFRLRSGAPAGGGG